MQTLPFQASSYRLGIAQGSALGSGWLHFLHDEWFPGESFARVSDEREFQEAGRKVSGQLKASA